MCYCVLAFCLFYDTSGLHGSPYSVQNMQQFSQHKGIHATEKAKKVITKKLIVMKLTVKKLIAKKFIVTKLIAKKLIVKKQSQ
jgi:hypothetical protein